MARTWKRLEEMVTWKTRLSCESRVWILCRSCCCCLAFDWIIVTLENLSVSSVLNAGERSGLIEIVCYREPEYGLVLGSELHLCLLRILRKKERAKLQKQESNTRGLCVTSGGTINSNNCHEAGHRLDQCLLEPKTNPLRHNALVINGKSC